MIGFDAHVKFAIVNQHRPHGQRRTDLQPTDLLLHFTDTAYIL